MDELERKEIDYVRGKVAGNFVLDRDGNTIVSTGETITDDIIARARENGQLHYLMIAAASSVVAGRGPEVKERLREFRDVTEGHEADFVRGETVHKDVTDYSGNVLLHEGEAVTDDTIERARHQGLLARLVVAVGAPNVDIDEEE